MAKNIQKVNSIEELNGFLGNGRIVYSIANCGPIWFVEFEDSAETNKTEDFESIVEKCVRLGYIEKQKIAETFYYAVRDWKSCAATVSECSIGIRREMASFCHLYYNGFIGETTKKEYFKL